MRPVGVQVHTGTIKQVRHRPVRCRASGANTSSIVQLCNVELQVVGHRTSGMLDTMTNVFFAVRSLSTGSILGRKLGTGTSKVTTCMTTSTSIQLHPQQVFPPHLPQCLENVDNFNSNKVPNRLARIQLFWNRFRFPLGIAIPLRIDSNFLTPMPC